MPKLEDMLKQSIGKKVIICCSDDTGDDFTVDGELLEVEADYILIKGSFTKIFINRKTSHIQTFSVQGDS